MTPDANPPALLFEPVEFAARLERLRAGMAERQVDLLVADQAEHLFHLTGYACSDTLYRACLVPHEGEPWIVLRDLDLEPCRQRSWLSQVIGYPDLADPLAEVARTIRRAGHGGARIGASFRSYAFTAWTRDRLAALLPQAEWVDLADLLEALPAVKSARELAYLEQAAAIADATMLSLAEAVTPGWTARDAAAFTAGEFLRRGADSGETGPIVRARGSHGFLHGHLAEEPLAPGDVLHVELVPRVKGYSARLMRPIAVGPADPALEAAAETLIALQDRQIEALRPGVEARAVDALLRRPLLESGLRTRFDNVSGYAIGYYGRTPRTSDFTYCFKPDSAWTLAENMTFHLYASAAGIAVSESVAVGPSGGRRLTRAPRRLLRAGGAAS
ncbi:Xaa-Pro dipeptidase [Tistlia consotensis]|uniref:Xaa-Pro dipeptidase n=1 Tax=Tistlia consotensis USBA 355 TaxID=560819 RepID=A0A1Y6B9E8_9PROT|nr:Xaa-Pro peptidase family protein [Tistlia consotensis]SME98302.1 Xaa-Pro dipeptidase [Tistlia consotensis USBA 355]SNR57614.1 Xaa-Pro dipeptidase [Tistlia consotensis]